MWPVSYIPFEPGIRIPYLGTGVCASEEHARSLASKSSGLARVAEVAETLDDVLHKAFLGEASLGQGQEGREHDGLGHHLEIVTR